MSEVYTTFLISLAVSAVMDGFTEILRYCRESAFCAREIPSGSSLRAAMS